MLTTTETPVFQHERGDCACGRTSAWLYSLVADGERTCAACTMHHAKPGILTEEEEAERRRQDARRMAGYHSARRSELHAAGLCIDCGKNKPPPTRKRCDDCAETHNARNRNARRRVRRLGPYTRRAA